MWTFKYNYDKNKNMILYRGLAVLGKCLLDMHGTLGEIISPTWNWLCSSISSSDT